MDEERERGRKKKITLARAQVIPLRLLNSCGLHNYTPFFFSISSQSFEYFFSLILNDLKTQGSVLRLEELGSYLSCHDKGYNTVRDTLTPNPSQTNSTPLFTLIKLL